MWRSDELLKNEIIAKVDEVLELPVLKNLVEPELAGTDHGF